MNDSEEESQQHTSTLTIVLHTANILLDLCGIALFGLVVLITVKQKKLQSTCHRLVGLYALCSVFGKSNTLLPFAQTQWPGIGPLPLYVCFTIGFVPLPCSFCIFPLMMAIGMDRAWCIMFPVSYSMRKERRLFRITLALLVLYYLFCAYIMFGEELFSQPNHATICNQQMGNARLELSYRLCICLTFACYLAILLKVLCHRDEAIVSIRQTLFKSLFLVVFIQIGGWLLVLSVYAWVSNANQQLLITAEQARALGPCLNCLSSVLTSAEVPILLWTSHDHRNAVKKQFRWLLLLLLKFKPKNSVGNAPYVVNMNMMKPVEMNQRAVISTINNNNKNNNAIVLPSR